MLRKGRGRDSEVAPPARKKRVRSYNPETRAEAISLRKKGKTIDEISRILGPCEKTLRLWFGEAGVDPGRRRYNRDAVLADIDAGMPRREVCAKYGCSRPWLAAILKGRRARATSEAT